MIKAELNKRSPLRILERSTNGGVGKGNIGVIAARKGVGKTACLVHIATDQLFQDKHVIHASFSSNTGHIISWYEDIFNEISKQYNLEHAMEVHDEIIRNRIIMNFNQNGVYLTQVAKSIKSMIKDGHFIADSIVIDGYDFAKTTAEELSEIKSLANETGLEIWLSSSWDDEDPQFDEHGVPGILTGIINEIAILICLKPQEDYIHLELIKDHDIFPISDLHLRLDPEVLLIEKADQ